MTATAQHQGPMVDHYGPTPPNPVIEAILCPPWCTGHFVDGEDAQGRMVIHYGPEFGHAGVPRLATSVDGKALDDSFPTCAVVIEEYDVAPDQLRQIAADTLAAAEWLEAHR